MGGQTSDPGRHILGGQLRMGLVFVGLSSRPTMIATDSPTGMARWSLSGLDFRIAPGWKVKEWRAT